MLAFLIQGILVYMCISQMFPEELQGITSFSTNEMFILVLTNYIFPAIVILVISKTIKVKPIHELLKSMEYVLLQRKKQKKNKERFILITPLIIVCVFILHHIYSKSMVVVRAEGVQIAAKTQGDLFQIYCQAFLAITALFYIIYFVIRSIFEISVLQKEEMSDLNKALAENEAYKEALENALKDLKQAGNAKSQFISRMSHDIKLPLNAIIGLSAIGIDEYKDAPKEQEYFTKIWNSGNYLVRLVNDILEFSKIESEVIELKPEPLYITDCIDDVYIMLRENIKEKHQKFIYRSSGDTSYSLMLDPIRIQQIITNLVSNAIKYTPEMGRIEVETLIEKNIDKAKLICMVKDNGIGMSPEFIKIMYEPYRHEKAKNESKGSGLGLAIVKNLVELMNGTITVKSKLNSGTEFRIELECDIAYGEKKKMKSERKVRAVLSGKRILLVEDNEINIAVESVLLQKKGMIVEVAKNGKEAIEMYQAHEANYYNAILMDVLMPVMNGLKATELIRSIEQGLERRIPIIGMSANSSESDIETAKQAGMDEYLTKPIEPEQIYATLSLWCSN